MVLSNLSYYNSLIYYFVGNVYVEMNVLRLSLLVCKTCGHGWIKNVIRVDSLFNWVCLFPECTLHVDLKTLLREAVFVGCADEGFFLAQSGTKLYLMNSRILRSAFTVVFVPTVTNALVQQTIVLPRSHPSVLFLWNY